MAICPFASVRLLDRQFLVGGGLLMAAHNRVNLHVAGGLGSLRNYFNQTNKPSSHFWVAKSGVVEQYVDTALRAEADLQGNDATVSIETESLGEAWTPAQLASITRLLLWLISTHPSIPKRLASSSKIGEESKGISWHRLGIDGNFPSLPSIYAGRNQRGGGMYYSASTGKVCPVEAPIWQIHYNILPALTDDLPVIPPVLTPEVSDMELISADGRGIALVAPGYYLSVTPDEADGWKAVTGRPIRSLTGAQFDAVRGSTSKDAVTPPVDVDEQAIADLVVAALGQTRLSVTPADLAAIKAVVISGVSGLVLKYENA